MARSGLISLLVLFSLGVEGFSLSMNDILGFGYRRIVESETPRVVEVVRWRQPVCLTAAPGVLPCLVSLRNPTQSREKNSLKEDLRILMYDESRWETNSDNYESNEEETVPDSLFAKKKQEIESQSTSSSSTPRIYSPTVVERVRLDDMGTSGFRNPLPEGARSGRYLRVAPQERRQTIYEIKVVDSPVVAKLVAETCLPDIGIPLCDEGSEELEYANTEYHEKSSLQYRKPLADKDDSKKPVVVIAKPPISVPVASGGAIQFWGADGSTGQLSQSITSLLNKPNVVQTDEKPTHEQVIVVQPTSSPGIFGGITALFPLGGGSNIFDIFNNKPPSGADNSPGWAVPFPGILQIPAIPSLQQILYKPENDISGNPGIFGLLTGGDKIPPGTGPPTEKPGIFGGLFASPSNPVNFDSQTSGSSPSPSLLDGIGNIFKPTNRPLVIERPNEPPILVEKPVYVVERPSTLGFFDIFQTGIPYTQSGTTEKPEVIKDPTYVFQKPVTSAPLFGTGLLPNWNIFNKKPTTTPAPAPVTPEIDSEIIILPVEPVVVDVTTTTIEEPIVPAIDIRLPEVSEVPEVPCSSEIPESPEIPEKPVVYRPLDNSDATAFSAAAVTVNGSEGSSSAVAVASATVETEKNDWKTVSEPVEKDDFVESRGNSENLLKIFPKSIRY